jgi:hypothetical protein
MIVYISIGNSDDKLTQREWSRYVIAIAAEVVSIGKLHGTWFSAPATPWQNACWCVEFLNDKDAAEAKEIAGQIRREHSQESVAWAIAETEFI